MVDRFCLERNLKPVSVSTIGRIIKYLKERGVISRGSEKEVELLCREWKIFLRGRGGGIRRYIIVGIDVATRFRFAYDYTHLSSRAARDFLEKFCVVAPFEIRGGEDR